MQELNWVKEPIPDPSTSEQQISEKLFLSGPRPHYLVCTYDGAVYDPEESKRLGRLKFKDVAITAVKLSTEPDYTSKPFMEEHATKYPRAYTAYLEAKSRGAQHNVRLLPKIKNSEVQELLSMGIETLEDLAVTTQELFELERFRPIARAILTPKPRLKLIDGKFVEAA